MAKTIKVLLLTDEAWNDRIYPNNNMTNWFTDFENIEIASIYCDSAYPSNSICDRYFQISDSMMVNSLIKGKKAGKQVQRLSLDNQEVVAEKQGIFNKLVTVISKTHSEFFKVLRDILWLTGRYDVEAIRRFTDDFKPDIIFTQRYATVKMLRLEKLLQRITNLPIVALTGDNEYSLKVLEFSPFFWMRRLNLHFSLNRMAKNYSHYYTSSKEQAELYQRKFGIPTGLMFKCAYPNEELLHNTVYSPIRLVYIGKLYCGRWKTLALLGEEIAKINKNGVKIVLDIYTRDTLTKKQQKSLNDGKNIFVKGSAKPEQIKEIYKNSDIVLHIESFDLKNRLITQHSYSTKVVDCLSSGCAVMVVGWKKHSACVQLKENNSAFVLTNKKEISDTLSKIANEDNTILEYAKLAMSDISNNHSRSVIQNLMYEDLSRIIMKGR